MNNKVSNKNKLSPLSTDLYEGFEKIIKNVYENAASIVSPEYKIPDGYYKISDNKSKENEKSGSKTDIMQSALQTALPAALTALALAIKAPSIAVVVLSGTGGIVGSFIQKIYPNAESELDRVEFESLTKNDIDVDLKIDNQKKTEMLNESLADVKMLCQEISEFEEEMKQRHDVSVNREFGEWVQNFFMYAKNHPDDRKLQLMKEALMDRLAEMKIYVYDEVVLDEDGHPAIPNSDYLIDRNDGAPYKFVNKPAVYSDRALLARGEIE